MILKQREATVHSRHLVLVQVMHYLTFQVLLQPPLTLALVIRGSLVSLRGSVGQYADHGGIIREFATVN